MNPELVASPSMLVPSKLVMSGGAGLMRSSRTSRYLPNTVGWRRMGVDRRRNHAARERVSIFESRYEGDDTARRSVPNNAPNLSPERLACPSKTFRCGRKSPVSDRRERFVSLISLTPQNRIPETNVLDAHSRKIGT